VAARPEGFERPWTRRRQTERTATATNAMPIAPTLPRDATPPQPDSDAEE
jgi:hypothetical protein